MLHVKSQMQMRGIQLRKYRLGEKKPECMQFRETSCVAK